MPESRLTAQPSMPRLSDLGRRFVISRSTISRLAEKAVTFAAYPVREALLFRSRARGDHKPDSDADIAVILKGKKGDRYKFSGDMAGIAFHVLMETGVMGQGVPLWEDEVARPETFSNPALIANILREGIHL